MDNKTEISEAVDLTSADSFQHWVRDSIRFADLDTLGHVNNVAFVTYFESGRVRFMSDYGIPVDSQDVVWMAVKLTVEYKAQMNWPGNVDIGTCVSKIGRTSLVVGAGLFIDGHCTSTSECVMVLVDNKSGRPTEIPAPLRLAFLNGNI